VRDQTISVTEAARNFADCVNRVRYQGASFVLLKNGVPVARIVPMTSRDCPEPEVGGALGGAHKEVHLGEEEAAALIRELEEARKLSQPSNLHKRPTLNW
jgi:prevent-host-death family protein